ncbi:MAG: hypothetical protein AAF938_04935, partial [Myxococcota bacterium]
MPAPNTISTARALVLFAGDGEALTDAIVEALRRKSVVVERCSKDELVRAVTVSAPDLVLLTGDLVADRGDEALAELAKDAVASVAPVALLLDDSSLDERLRAFRSGAVGVVERDASADAVATRIATLCAELPDRPGEATGSLGEATLDELAALIASRLRSGVLSVESEGDAPVRLLLGSGGDVASVVDGFVQQLRPLVAEAKPLRYELFEASGGRIQLWDGADEDSDAPVYEDLRIVIMDDDPGRADEFAVALRERGALVAITSVSGRGIERARALDPAVIVLDSTAIEGSGFEIVRRIRRDPRLRWASLLVAKWHELWPDELAAPDLDRVSARLGPLVKADRELVARSKSDEPFDTRLELTGPSRLLRAVASAPGSRVVAVRSTRIAVDVDLSDNLVVSAQGLVEGRNVAGQDALSALLELGSGRVRIERRLHPAAANLMLPVDEALDAAKLRRGTTSLPPPPLLESEPAPPRSTPAPPDYKPPPEARRSDPAAAGAPPRSAQTQLGLGGFAPSETKAPTVRPREREAQVASMKEADGPTPDATARAEAALGEAPTVPPDADDIGFGETSLNLDVSPSDLSGLHVGAAPLDPLADLSDSLAPRDTIELDDDLDIDFVTVESERPGVPSIVVDASLQAEAEAQASLYGSARKARGRAWGLALAALLLAGGGAFAYAMYGPGRDAQPAPETARAPADGNAEEANVEEPNGATGAPEEPPAAAPEPAAEAMAAAGADASDRSDGRGADAETPAPANDEATNRAATNDGPEAPVPDARSDADETPATPEAAPAIDVASLSAAERDRASDAAARRAETAAREGNLTLALREAEDALHLAARNPQALAARASVAIAARNGADAVRWATRATERRPRRA